MCYYYHQFTVEETEAKIIERVTELGSEPKQPSPRALNNTHVILKVLHEQLLL